MICHVAVLLLAHASLYYEVTYRIKSEVRSGVRLALRVSYGCEDSAEVEDVSSLICLSNMIKKKPGPRKGEENCALNFIPLKKKHFSK